MVDRARCLQLLAEGIKCLEARQFARAQLLGEQAASSDPGDSNAWNLVGVALARQGQRVRAAAAIARAIALNPGVALFHANLGNAESEQAQYEQAVASYDRAIALKPDYAEAYCNRGIALKALRRFDAAVASLDRAIALKPNSAAAHFHRGIALQSLRRVDEAIASYDRVIALKPDLFEAYNNRGTALQSLDRFEEAQASFERGLRLAPRSTVSLYNIGLCHYRANRLDQADVMCRNALTIDPKSANAHWLSGRILRARGQHAEAIAAWRRAVELDPRNAGIHSNLLFALNYQEDVTPEAVFAEHRAWGARHGIGARPRMDAGAVPDEAERPLRVGYVSADLRSHSVAYFLEPLLAARDRSAFHVVCYANSTRQDATTTRLRALADGWRVVATKTDDAAEALIRADGIDILVDLSGHTGHNRLSLFARRTAPVQVTYLGYPNTTGLTTMDYRLSDEWADPIGLTEAFHTETLVRLEGGFLCYRAPDDAPAVAPSPALAAGRVTFGSFNNLAKVSSTLIGRWAAILAGVPGSRLILKAKPLADAGTRSLVLAQFAQHGIGADRLDLMGWTDATRHHLERYGEIDIALDTFPYHGTTTTCEALWMGVPVVTCSGRVHASRVGVSLLSGIGLDDLIASSMDSYVATAIALARDVARLGHLRDTLRPRMAASPLMDRARVARVVEAAYRRMWRRHCGRAS